TGATILEGNNYTFGFNCTDGVRLLGSNNISFNVDTSNPHVLEFSNPEKENYTTGGNVNLTVQLSNSSSARTIKGTDFSAVYFMVTNMTTFSNTNFSINITNATTGNGTRYSIGLSVENVRDGNHTVVVFVNDTAGNANKSLAINSSFIVDTRGPNPGIVNSTFNTANNTPLLAVNFTDNVDDLMNCTLYNSTGTTKIDTNNTIIANGTTINLKIVNALGDKVHSVALNCTDGVRLVNASAAIDITVDTTIPVVSTSSASVTTTTADLSVTTNEASTCKVDTSSDVAYDSMASTMAGGGLSHTLLITDLSAGSSHTRYVRCRDDLLNTMVTSTAVDFTTSSSGGGGGGGSGGGVSSGAAGTFEKGVWQSVLAGETATVTIKNGVIGVTKVSFDVKETTYGAWLEVRKVDTLPSTVAAFGEKAYKTIRITESNVEKVLQGMPTIEFKVLKTWLSDNQLTKDKIALFRYVEGQWNELSTTVGEDDGTYIHYTSRTPGFSYFVIGVKGAAAPIGQEVTGAAPAEAPGAPAVGEQPETAPEVAGPETAMKQRGIAVWLVPLIVLVVLAVILYLYWKKR
ncbi:PGF-pre-PGF domain-containing protein, partial [Candidatus Woesearchaeota archaeon]|nr:PGF-pre-PGF domain-containing protein [Candidatus Woesearchaeota archaeon]